MANFTGTDADEIIIPGFVSPTVTTSGGSRPSNAADVINAGGGDDVIDSSGGNDVVTGGRGNDVAILGSGDDTFIWNPLDGSDTVEGQRGFDTLLFNGSNANENIEISANGGRTTLFRDVGNVTMDLAGIERIALAALDGADTVVVNDLSGTAVKQVAIDLSAQGGGDNQPDTVIVSGTPGNNRITVAGSGGSVTVSGLPAQVTIGGAEAANDLLVINGLAGNDTVDTSALAAGTIGLMIDGGFGNDTITGSGGSDVLIGGDGDDRVTGGRSDDVALLGDGNDVFIWNPGDSSDLVEGQDGFDTLKFNGSDASETIALSANGSRALLSRDVGGVAMDLNGVERIDIAAAGGPDTIVVNDLTGTGVTQVAIDLARDDANDQVIVNGSSGNDFVIVDRSGGAVRVSGLAETVTIAGANAGHDQLSIFAGLGNDIIDASDLAANQFRLTLNGGAGNDTILGGRGNDTVVGGSGNDVAALGAGDDEFVWNPGDGSDTVDGQSGSDRLVFIGSSGGERFELSANGAQATLSRDVGSVTMRLAGVERIELAALGGADTITVNDLAGTSVQQVAIDLQAQIGSDGEPDTVTVNATAGKDHISVESDGSFVVVEGLSARVTIDGVESANDSLIVNGLDGNDTIDASGLRAGQIKLAINGGAGTDVITGSAGDDLLNGGSGNDTMNGGDGNDAFVWNPGDGSDVLRGGAGTDTLLFNGADVNESVVLSADGGRAVFSRDVATITMNMDDVETIDFNALGGTDTVTINDLTGTGVKQVNIDLAASAGGTTGDAQDDTIIINGTAGDDAISLSIENGALVISGLASKITIEHFDANDTIRIAGLGGDDVIDASGIGAGGPKLILDGGDDDDILIGGDGNDTILGGAGDDVLSGGPGQDVLDGGPGNNVVIQDLVNSFDLLL
ncbi:MAG TPA: calcium-binding protein [Vicinamibacterales bacterium]|nr:calcium-binding protein [Vicinamibacterales bacterium]